MQGQPLFPLPFFIPSLCFSGSHFCLFCFLIFFFLRLFFWFPFFLASETGVWQDRREPCQALRFAVEACSSRLGGWFFDFRLIINKIKRMYGPDRF